MYFVWEVLLAISREAGASRYPGICAAI